MILDTTFLIDILRKNSDALRKLDDMESGGESLKTTSVSVFELFQGVRFSHPEKETQIAELLNQLMIFPLDTPSARTAGRIASDLKRNGREIEPEDSMIAGIALERKESLLTRNKDHFSRIEGLDVRSY